ncbi:MAG: GNAT family N-acetyltransferase [Candidatus Hydrogenedentes bacterium]|nr:GNAT family N-acetyltransferase [Candidatus Hydrogenedentota bacterium]
MIRTGHAVIRATIPDDAGALFRLYDPRAPRAALLDQRREMLMPTAKELEETLVRQESGKAGFFTVELPEGEIAGFCALRGQNAETRFGEVALLMLDSASFESGVAHDALGFLKDRAFAREHLRKVVAHCLEREAELRGFLIQEGFESGGRQRDAFYTQGRYETIESLALYSASTGASHGH